MPNRFTPKNRKGSLEVICGPMFSGKSEELMRKLRRAEIAQHTVLTVKNGLDDRHGTTHVVSHDGVKRSAFPINQVEHILTLAEQYQATVVGIDEIQFFPVKIVDIVARLVQNGVKVIAAGLDLDFRGVPFTPMPLLLALADKVKKLRAVCTACGHDAHFSQRLINGNPANYDDPVIMIGADESYQARCRACFSIDKVTHF